MITPSPPPLAPPLCRWLPGLITTEPNSKIVFNAPFSESHVYNIRLKNNGAHRIGFALQTTNPNRLEVRPSGGALGANGIQICTLTRKAFFYCPNCCGDDKLVILWINAPIDAAKPYRREWFQEDGVIFRKNLPIEYNW